MAGEDVLAELEGFLNSDTRLDVRLVAMSEVLGLSLKSEGHQVFLQRPSLISCLGDLIFDSSKVVSKDAFRAIVNLTANENVVPTFLTTKAADGVLDLTLDPSFPLAELACMTLANMTRSENGSRFVFKQLSDNGHKKMAKLIEVLCVTDYNPEAKLSYVATVLSNVSQLKECRLLFLGKEFNFLQRVLPFIHFKDSLIRRGGIVGLVRNICFESEFHEWLLSEEVDLLPALLLPLAGPEEFDEDVMDQLPVDLQYLPEDKEREEDPDLRKMLIEALMQLCATAHGRKTLRDKNTYFIMRECHRSEKDPDVGDCCERLIGMLIADEPEPGMENLRQVKVPEYVAKQCEEVSEDTTSTGKDGCKNGDVDTLTPECSEKVSENHGLQTSNAD